MSQHRPYYTNSMHQFASAVSTMAKSRREPDGGVRYLYSLCNPSVKARQLIRRAEWTLGIVSAVTLLFSVWASLILPRQVTKPLVGLKETVDHAATGNYEIDFELHGGGEVVDLAKKASKT
jgi:hypothetical protein